MLRINLCRIQQAKFRQFEYSLKTYTHTHKSILCHCQYVFTRIRMCVCTHKDQVQFAAKSLFQYMSFTCTELFMQHIHPPRHAATLKENRCSKCIFVLSRLSALEWWAPRQRDSEQESGGREIIIVQIHVIQFERRLFSFFIGLTFFVLFFFLLFYFRRNFCICRLRRCRSVACVQLIYLYTVYIVQ